MSDIRGLYQELILDHNRSPRNFHSLPDANRVAEGYNPLCGDRFSLYLKVSEEGLVSDVGFQGSGCAISKASASLMTAAIKGKKTTEAEALAEKFLALVTGTPITEADETQLGKLIVFSGVAEFPVRVKCASLAWRTCQAALLDVKKTISTE